MSRLNQHLKAVIAPEQETVAVESWIDLPSVDLDYIHEGMETQVALEYLAENVEGTQDTASLEGYDWAYKAITQLTELAPESYPSLEDHGEPELKRTALAASIRQHHDALDVAINAALEEYTQTFGNSLKTILDSFAESAKALNMEDVKVPEESVKIDSGRLWTMVHVDNKMVKDLCDQIQTEEAHLKTLIAHANKVTGTIDPSKGKENDKSVESVMNSGAKQQLLFNTTATFAKGKSIFSKNTAPKPKREKRTRDYVRGGIGWGLLGLFFWGPAGLGLGAAAGAAVAFGGGDFKTRKVETEKELREFVRLTSKLVELRGSIEAVAKDLDAKVEKADDDHKAEVKRQAALVMELLGNIVSHISELLYGSAMLIKKIK